jgi:AAA+ superfamily predicted ATPase
MNIHHLIGEALCQPLPALSYLISQRLAIANAGKAIVEGEDGSFDLEEYARAGHCTLARRTDLHGQIQSAFDGDENAIVQRAQNVWFNVVWRGHALDVLLMTWREGWSETKYYWIIAPTHDVAEQFFLAVCEWATEIRDEVLVFEHGFWCKNEELFRAIKTATFDNLVLHGTLKHDILDDLRSFFDARDTYDEYGVPWKRGVLLIGPPGNGKTHTVKALVNALRQPCLYVKSFKAEHGTDHHNISTVFKRARESAPCVLVLEDLDSLITGDNRSFFLNEMDGFATNNGILTLATTNHPERLDAAILDRPSRFDRKYHFPIPAHDERLAYIRLWNGSLKAALQLNDSAAATIAAQTEGFSFAYLKELFLASMVQWINLPEPRDMQQVMLAQIAALREEMISSTHKPADPPRLEQES